MKKNLDLWVTLGLCFIAIIWGSGFIATQIAIDEGLSASFIMFVRFTVASVILGITSHKEIKKMKKTDMKAGIIAGLFLFLGFLLQTIGLNFTTPSSNAFITATSVVMVPFLSWVAFKKKPANKAFIAAFVCLIGIGTIALSSGGGLKFGLGDSITLICAVAFAFHAVTMGVFAPKIETKVLTFLQITVSAVLSFVVFLVSDGNFAGFTTARGLLAVLYLAVFSTCICYSVQTWCQKYAAPTKVSIIVSCEALVGSLLSVSMGFEPLTYYLLVGGIIVVFSVIMIEVNITVSDKIKEILSISTNYKANQE